MFLRGDEPAILMFLFKTLKVSKLKVSNNQQMASPSLCVYDVHNIFKQNYYIKSNEVRSTLVTKKKQLCELHHLKKKVRFQNNSKSYRLLL